MTLLKEWSNNATISVVIMKGSGEKAFCAGGDVGVSRVPVVCTFYNVNTPYIVYYNVIYIYIYNAYIYIYIYMCVCVYSRHCESRPCK